MDKEKIVYNVEPLEYSEEAIFNWKKFGFTYVEGSWKELLNKEKFENVRIVIVRLGGYLNEEVLNKFPNIKYIISATTGQDHLDINSIKQKKIQLITLKGEDNFLRTIPSTAEHTWALLLTLIRNINDASAHVRSGGWNRDDYKGFQLKNKKIGIIGLGRIGEMIAKYAKVFDMDVLYFDPYVENNDYKRMDSLLSLVKTSDIISIHVHLNSSTEKLISKDILFHVKKGAFLINTSRGKILDEVAVVEALEDKTLSGVAVDVLSEEIDNNITKSALWKCQEDHNVIITPHIAGATYDAMWTCEEYVQNLYIKKNLN
jgi:D-3-phosphoglycerate dehydrogenase